MSNLHKYYAEFSGEQEIKPQEKIKAEPSSELSNLHQYYSQHLQTEEPQKTYSGSAALETVTDFETNPQVIKDYETVMDALARNKTYTSGILDTAAYSDDGPAEFLRDLTMRIGTKVNLATEAGDWSQEEKRAFTRLQSNWEKVSVTGMREWASAIKDYGIDAVANLETIPAIASLIFQGGTGVAAAQVGSRTALSKVLAKVAVASQPTTKTGFAAMGAAYGAGDDISLQNLEIETGQKEEYDKAQTYATAAVGALAGAGLKKGMELFQSRNTSKVAKALDEKDLNVKVVSEVPEDQGIKVFEESLADESMPVSANEVIYNLGRVVEDTPNFSAQTIEELLQFPQSPLSKSIRKLSKDSGGGKQTVEEIENIILQSAETGATGKEIRYLASHGIWKGTTALIGKTYGKAAGLLTPYVKYSNDAKTLQKVFNFQFGIGYKTTKDIIGQDFSETAARITGDLNVEYFNNIEPIAMHQLTGEVEDSVNDALNLTVRGRSSGVAEIDTAGKQIRATFRKVGRQLKKYGIIKHNVENYFPRMWDRKAIDEGQDELANIFVKVGEAKDLTEGRAIVAEMLDKENQLSSGTSGHFFSATRAFEKITDDSLVAKFLNPDVRTTIMDYNFQAGKALAKKITLGVSTEEQFINRWVNGIDADMRKAGKPLTRRDKQNIVDLYRTATGENLTRYSPEIQNVADAYTLTTRYALLGGVTVSSLTEIMVNLGRAGFRNTAKAFVEASEIGFKKATKDIHSDLQARYGMTAKEAYREFQSVNIAMEQSSTPVDASHRLGGGDLVNEKMQRLSNKFFRLTFLDQWTKFVQRVSFIASKNFIEENLNTIAKHGSLKPTKKIESIMGELNELDINPEQGVEWIKNGAKRSDKFYQNIINGSARYTNQVILHPTGMSGNKPMLHAKPTTAILFQLMGYPAAFTNTVLKGGFQRLVKDPTRNGFKLASTALIMTETARMTNWIRSRGESEKNKSTEEIYTAAIARWGGFGLAADQAIKGEKALDYNRSVGATIATSLGGPAISDLNTLLTRGPVQTLQQKVPFSSLGNAIVGKQKMKDWRKLGRKTDTALKEALDIEEDYKATFNKGGEVNVPNAPAEPDERVNKLTGLPYNYEAGSAYMDEDDPLKIIRSGFVLGGAVKGITKLASKAFSPKGDSGFFSMAEKKAMDLNQNKGSGDQFISLLKKNGVTEDELEFTGFSDEFAGKPKVTKEEVVSYLNVNRLDVTESVGYLPDRKGIEEAERAQVGSVFDDIPDDPINQIRNKLEQTEAELDDLIEIESSRALTSEEEDLMNQLAEEIELLQSDYAIRSEDPFGEFRSDDIPEAMLVEGSDFNPELIHKEYAWNGLDTVNYREVAIKVPDDKSGIEKPFKPYTTQHFPEQENVIAHVRFGDIFSPNSKDKILLIDEAQSDFWQQKSRYGKRDKIKFPDYKDQIQDSVDKGELYYNKLKKELDIAKTEKRNYSTTTKEDEKLIKKLKLEQDKLNKEISLYDDELATKGITQERVDEIYEKYDLLEYELEGYTDIIKEYTDSKAPDELIRKIADLESKLEDTAMKLVDLSASIEKNYISEYAPTPNMPFMPRKSTGVTKLTMNRALMEAVKGDYNTVAFTTAQQQMDRYNMSGDKGKSFIEKYDKDIPKFFTNFLEKYNQKLVMKKVYKQGENDEKRKLVKVPSFIITEQMRKDIQRGLPQFNKGGRVRKDLGGLIAKAIGMKSEDIEWAKSIDKTYHKDEAFDGKGDAARHLALGWAASQSENPEMSLKAINAREYVTFDGVGREMDTYNNELGFKIQANSQAEAQREINKLIESKAAKYMTLQESKALRGYAKGGKVLNKLKRNCA